jgi:hypothetical protein
MRNAQSCSIDIFPASESLEETQLNNSDVKVIRDLYYVILDSAVKSVGLLRVWQTVNGFDTWCVLVY